MSGPAEAIIRQVHATRSARVAVVLCDTESDLDSVDLSNMIMRVYHMVLERDFALDIPYLPASLLIAPKF